MFFMLALYFVSNFGGENVTISPGTADEKLALQQCFLMCITTNT